MFQDTCTTLLKTMIPIITAWSTKQGKIGWGVGAGVIINDEGWFITAAHILQQMLNVRLVSLFHDVVDDDDPIKHYGSAFGQTGASMAQAFMVEQADMGVGKLKNYTPPNGHVFPKLRTSGVQRGELLCRIGYPFVDHLQPTWNNGKFEFANMFPVPPFANEALVSRFIRQSSGVWFETSSPGLKGQSGGPLADSAGLICGIQVNTRHYDLQFEGAGSNQFLNVGRAIHVDTIREFLDKHDINYSSE